MLRLKLSENNDILRNFNVAHVFVLIWLGEINMAGIITNFQAPDNLEDLEEAYNKYQGTNLDGILEDAKKHYTAWTVGRKSQIGDIVFFFCAATAIDKIKKAYREARKADKLIEFAEKQKELYEKFSGHIVAWGRIIAKPCDFDFGWGAEIEVVEAIDIPYSAFKSFIKISTFGAITFLNDEKLSKLEELVGTYNEGELETIVVKPALREGKRIEVYGTKYERNAKIRREFLSKQAKPYKCAVCGFDYEKHYGQLGKDYIEVHHKTPLSVNGNDVEIDLENDLVCLCANCHRMIHRKKGVIMTVEELKVIINKRALLVGGLPFDVRMPEYNDETIEAMQEALDIEAGKIPAKRYHSAQELFDANDADIAAHA